MFLHLLPCLLVGVSSALADAPVADRPLDALVVPRTALPAADSAGASGGCDATDPVCLRLLEGPDRSELPVRRFEVGVVGGYAFGVRSAVATGSDWVYDGLGFDPKGAGLALRWRAVPRVWIGVRADGSFDFWDGNTQQLNEAQGEGQNPARWLFSGRVSLQYAWENWRVRPEFGVEAGPAVYVNRWYPVASGTQASGLDARVQAGLGWFPVEAFGLRLTAFGGVLALASSGATMPDSSEEHQTFPVDSRLGSSLTVAFPL